MTHLHLRPRRIALAALLAWLPLAACSKGTQAGDDASANQVSKREPTKVRVATVDRRETVRRLETTTRVEAEHQVEIFPRAAGVVRELLVEEGDQVEAGRVLARLDDRESQIAKADAQTALDEALANLPKLALAVREATAQREASQRAADQAVRDHERNAAISEGEAGKPGLISRRDLDASRLARDQALGELESSDLAEQRAIVEEQAGQAAVDRARLGLERAELDLSYMEITAPFDGVIAERSIDVGATLAISQPAFVLSDRRNLRAVFYRPQRELALFRLAGETTPDDDLPANGGAADGHGLLEIEARAEALPGRVFHGSIERIAPTIDPASGNFRVTARMEVGEPPHNLLPGMLVRLSIVTDRHPDALMVPKRAIRREGDRDLVFVVRDGRAHEVVVEEGFADGDDVEVIAESGSIAAGDQVVVVGNRDLEDGAQVAIPEDDGEAADGATPPAPPAEDPAATADAGD